MREGGRIINLSTSIIGHYSPGNAVYTATKAAVEAMTRILAKELGSRRITVNAVAPGPVATELLLAGRSPELIQRLTNEILSAGSGSRRTLPGSCRFWRALRAAGSMGR